MHKLICLGLALLALPVQAAWYLDYESSRLSFISTKNATLSEVGRFLVMHGKRKSYASDLLVTRLDEHRFQVVTLSPLVLDAADFDLAPGIETLRKLAGAGSIGLSVPVGAVLIFTSR